MGGHTTNTYPKAATIEAAKAFAYTEGEPAIRVEMEMAGYVWKALKTWAADYGYPVPYSALQGHSSSDTRFPTSAFAYVTDEKMVEDALKHAYNISPDERTQTAQFQGQLVIADTARKEYFESFDPSEGVALVEASRQIERAREPRRQ